MSKTRHGVLDLNSMNHTRSLSDTVPSIHTHPFDLKPTFCTQSTQPMQGSRQSRDNKALTHTHRHTLSSQLHNHSDNSHMEYPCVIKTKHTDKTETHTHTHKLTHMHPLCQVALPSGLSDSLLKLTTRKSLSPGQQKVFLSRRLPLFRLYV